MRTMIKYLRQELKMSQKELGDKVGVTRQTINALENGRYNPSLFLAYEITQVFNKLLFKGDRERYFVMEDIFILSTFYHIRPIFLKVRSYVFLHFYQINNWLLFSV